MTFPELLAWVNATYPAAHYGFEVRGGHKLAGDYLDIEFWLFHELKTAHVDGHSPEDIRRRLEASIDRFGAVDLAALNFPLSVSPSLQPAGPVARSALTSKGCAP